MWSKIDNFDSFSFFLCNFVKIFVLVDDQRVRLTLGINDTEYVRQNIDEIKKYVVEGKLHVVKTIEALTLKPFYLPRNNIFLQTYLPSNISSLKQHQYSFGPKWH